jgi:hypothetical protein
MLSQNDYRRIGPLLWHKCLDSMGSHALAAVSFYCPYAFDHVTSGLLVGLLLDNAVCREDYQ